MADERTKEPVSPPAPAPPAAGPFARLDAWMDEHPWHPRVAPFLTYLVFLLGIDLVRPSLPAAYPLLYAAQCGVVAWMLWRYRRRLPELTVRFHALAIPVGVAVAAAWVWLGMLVAHAGEARAQGLSGFTADLARWVGAPEDAVGRARFIDPEVKTFFDPMGTPLGWAAMVLRLLGMSLLVPLFEELFIRSLMLRSLSRGRRTLLGVVQAAGDLPVLGDWLANTRLGRRAEAEPPAFAAQFLATPLGHLTAFGVCASTAVFMLSHGRRDWPGAVVCGVAYCLLLGAATRWGERPERGLGSVVWAHGITNALLWGYTLWTGDWRFL